MKEKDIEFGQFNVGPFVIQVQSVVFSKQHAENATFFEVSVTEERTLRNEKGSLPYPFYINLIEDKRFKLFSDFGKFNKTITAEEAAEYTSYIVRKNLQQPIWKLSRRTLCEIFELAQKAKRRTMMDVKNEMYYVCDMTVISDISD